MENNFGLTNVLHSLLLVKREPNPHSWTFFAKPYPGAHYYNQNECLIFAAEIPNKHPFLIRCNRQRLGGVLIVRTCQFLFRLFMCYELQALGLLLYSIYSSPLSNVVKSLLKWFVH